MERKLVLRDVYGRDVSPLCGIKRFLQAEVSLEEHMGEKFSVCEVRWERYPRAAESAHPRAWMTWQCNRGLAANTLEAYGLLIGQR
jgi:hypothetical protein